MSNELNTTNSVEEQVTEEKVVTEAKPAKRNKKSVKEFFVGIWKKIVKLCKDTKSEMKKVTWTSKTELKKSTKLVLVSIVAVGIAIAIIDLAFSFIINTTAGFFG